jgi:Tol biopolymer transport system component
MDVRGIIRWVAVGLAGALLAPGQAAALGVDGMKANGDSQVKREAFSDDGGLLVFRTYATNLTADDAAEPFSSDIYLRDLDIGATRLVSRASGAAGAKQNGSAFAPAVAGGGDAVAFESNASNLDPADTDTHISDYDVFVRDLDTGLTTLVSRASGASGAAGSSSSHTPSISADGRYVAFVSGATNLSPDDPSSDADVYVRDRQTNTTILVSRASGPGGAKANAHPSSFPSISADGRYVAFASNGSNLVPGDTNNATDIFVRDLQADTTTLVSRADGLTGALADSTSVNPAISADGGHVAFESDAGNLDAEDTDSLKDVYVRDLGAGTTTLASRAPGPAGADGNGSSYFPSISADGDVVGFNSEATNLSPDDPGAGTVDYYVRDLGAATTTLESRASGSAGAKANGTVFEGGLSADGTLAVFASTATNLHPADTGTTYDVYVRDLAGAVTYLESRASASYARPKGATPVRAPLVPALAACTSPNRTHGPPLAFGSCNPPAGESAHLTVGTPDANGAAPNSEGVVRYAVIAGTPGPPSDSDVAITASISDVRCEGAPSTCGAANGAAGPDYTGELRVEASRRMTDRLNGSGSEPGTVADDVLAFAIPCAATASIAVGATCSASTSANALVPGMVVDGKRAIWQLGQVRVLDGGPDGSAETAPNTPFAVQGLFVP